MLDGIVEIGVDCMVETVEAAGSITSILSDKQIPTNKYHAGHNKGQAKGQCKGQGKGQGKGYHLMYHFVSWPLRSTLT